MINGNPATINGKVYYRDDAKTKVATATGAYLADLLDNSVINTSDNGDSSPKEAWTGAKKGENCSSWTNNSSTNNLSHVGVIDTNTLKKAWWRSTRSRSCDANLGIYCVSE